MLLLLTQARISSPDQSDVTSLLLCVFVITDINDINDLFALVVA